MRVESDIKAFSRKDGTPAWIHSIGESFGEVKVLKPKRARLKSSAEMEALAKEAFLHERAKLERILLASELGVSVHALEEMRVGFRTDSGGNHTLWPSRGCGGEIIGAVRRYHDGSKKSFFGGAAGVFYAPTQSVLTKYPVLIVEGASDVAAACTIGLSAIGRPSNTGGVDLLFDLDIRFPIVVVGERDESPERRGRHDSCPIDCAGCANCYPGMYGAKLVAGQLGCRWILPPEGCKDLRDVLIQGRVREFLRIVSRK